MALLVRVYVGFRVRGLGFRVYMQEEWYGTLGEVLGRV
jgi:hypothetical protein